MARGDGSIIDAVETFSRTSAVLVKTMIVLAVAILLVTATNLFIPIFYAKVNQENFNIYQFGDAIYKFNKKTGEVYILAKGAETDLLQLPDWVRLQDVDTSAK